MGRFFGRNVQYLLLVAALPIIGYQFGVGNQVEQFSLIRRLSDPGFLPGDFYIDSAATFGPRFYYSLMLAGLTKLMPLPAVIFVLSYLTNLAVAAISYDAVKRHLGAERLGAALAALIVIVNSGFALGLAGYLHFESYQPANPAIALALAGVSALVAGRRILGALAFGGACLFHPVVGVETALVAYVGCAMAELVRARGVAAIVRAWLGYVPSGLLFSVIVAAAWVAPSLGHSSASIPSAEIFDTLIRFRAPHHYLARGFPKLEIFRAGLFVLALAWMLWTQLRQTGLRFQPVALGLACATVLGLCAGSVLFVDVLHNLAYATAQPFRMLMLVKWVGYLLFAWTAARWIKTGSPLHWVAALAPILATGEAQPYVLVAALLMVEAAERLKIGALLSWAGALLLALFAAREGYRLGEWNELVRAGAGMLVFLAFFVAVAGQALFRLGAVAAVASLIAVGVVNAERGDGGALRVLNPTYDWTDLKGPDADIARWIKLSTPKDSIWIVPPDDEAFRLLAERAVVADFTSIPFQDLAMREWKQRMAALYGPLEGSGFGALDAMRAHYRKGDVQQIEAAARRYGASYAVLYADTPWPGPVLRQNAEYKAVKLFGASGTVP